MSDTYSTFAAVLPMTDSNGLALRNDLLEIDDDLQISINEGLYITGENGLSSDCCHKIAEYHGNGLIAAESFMISGAFHSSKNDPDAFGGWVVVFKKGLFARHDTYVLGQELMDSDNWDNL